MTQPPYPPLRYGHPCPACGAEPVGDPRAWPLDDGGRADHTVPHYPGCQHPAVLAVSQPSDGGQS